MAYAAGTPTTPTTPAAAAAGTSPTAVALHLVKQVRAGQRTTMSATVSATAPAPAAASPSGTVTFSDRGRPISGCRPQRLSRQRAMCSVSFVVSGRHPISARYGGNAVYAASTSPTSTLAVTPIPVKGDITARSSWVFLFTPTYTEVIQLNIGGLYEGSDVVVGCQGRGCPFRSEDFPVLRPKKCPAGVPANSCPPNNFFLAKYFAGRRLAPTSQITLLISHPSYVGKYYGFTMRARKTPQVTIACLAPDSTLPGAGCRPRPDQHIPG